MPTLAQVMGVVGYRRITLTFNIPDDEPVCMEFRPWAEIRAEVEPIDLLLSSTSDEDLRALLVCRKFALCCASWNMTHDNQEIRLTPDDLLHSGVAREHLEWLLGRAYAKPRHVTVADIEQGIVSPEDLFAINKERKDKGL
jgi:hypothetical protein